MLRHNSTAVQLMVTKLAIAGGPDDIVAAIIDTRDELGRDLAEHMGVAREVARIAGPDRIPTILGVVARLDAVRALEETHPRVAAGLAIKPPPSQVPVVVIASGGITLVCLERVAMPTLGEA